MKSLRDATLLAALLGVLSSGCDRAQDPMAPPRADLVFSQGTEAEPNNTCQSAQDVGAVTLPYVLDGSLDGSPLPNGDVDFVRFSATPNTSVRVDLEGQGTGKGTLGDPFLGFFDSSCNLIAVNDDGGGNLNSRLVITIPGDGIAVLGVTRCCDSGFDQGGNGTYQLTIQEIVPPLNDDFANAATIPAIPYADDLDLTAASSEANEPTALCADPYGGASRTAWYSFTPAVTQSVTASMVNAQFPTVVAAYTGTSLASLTEVGCGVFGGPATFRAEANTTYYVQVGGLFGLGGPLEFRLDETPDPVANFGYNPGDPSILDVVQFFDNSFDPGGLGIQSQAWDFGDGTTPTGCCPTHRYAADGEYAVHLTVTTIDGRTGSTSQPVSVRTHDVAIIRLSAPKAATAGQTRGIVVSVNSKRYGETVEVQLYKSVPGGYQQVGSLTNLVPVRSANRTTDFKLSYTFSADDARIGKVTFRAFANILGARDALPADNEAIASPTSVSR